MRTPRLSEHETYRINRWLDDCGMRGRTRTEVARIASESLGFEVTASNISKAEKAIGIQIQADNKQTSSIIAQDIIDLRKELGLSVSDEIERIAKRQGL